MYGREKRGNISCAHAAEHDRRSQRETGATFPGTTSRSTPGVWLARMLKGLRCRWKLDRRAASHMVYVLDNYGERSAAIEACRQVVKRQPQNVHGYLNMIDMVARGHGDLSRADKYCDLGLATLNSFGDRDLLLSFHLYTSTLTRRH